MRGPGFDAHHSHLTQTFIAEMRLKENIAYMDILASLNASPPYILGVEWYIPQWVRIYFMRTGHQ